MTEISGRNRGQAQSRRETTLVRDTRHYAVQRQLAIPRTSAVAPRPAREVVRGSVQQSPSIRAQTTMVSTIPKAPTTTVPMLPTEPIFAKTPPHQAPRELPKAPKPAPTPRRYAPLPAEPQTTIAPEAEVVEPQVVAHETTLPQPISRSERAHSRKKSMSLARLRHAFRYRKPSVKLVPAKKSRVPSKKRLATWGIIVIMIATGYVMLDTLRTNNQVRQQVSSQSSVALSTNLGSSASTKAGEGKDETAIKPSVIDNYKVAADLPRVITISKIGVRARVLPMSVNSDGSLQAPSNIYDAGWYASSAKPGTVGAVAIDGHSSGATREGLFGSLDTLAAGDAITIERGDGTKIDYTVMSTETIPLGDVDMTKFLSSQNGAADGLNIMTCTGKWINNNTTMDHRIIVYARQV